MNQQNFMNKESLKTHRSYLAFPRKNLDFPFLILCLCSFVCSLSWAQPLGSIPEELSPPLNCSPHPTAAPASQLLSTLNAQNLSTFTNQILSEEPTIDVDGERAKGADKAPFVRTYNNGKKSLVFRFKDSPSHPDRKTRFLHEKEINAYLKSQNIPGVLTWETITPLPGGEIEVEMPLYNELSLFEYSLKESKKANVQDPTTWGISAADLLPIAKQTCTTLVELHRRHVLHRDVKKENMVIHKDGNRIRSAFIDFGFSFILGEPATRDPHFDMETRTAAHSIPLLEKWIAQSKAGIDWRDFAEHYGPRGSYEVKEPSLKTPSPSAQFAQATPHVATQVATQVAKDAFIFDLFKDHDWYGYKTSMLETILGYTSPWVSAGDHLKLQRRIANHAALWAQDSSASPEKRSVKMNAENQLSQEEKSLLGNPLKRLQTDALDILRRKLEKHYSGIRSPLVQPTIDRITLQMEALLKCPEDPFRLNLCDNQKACADLPEFLPVIKDDPASLEEPINPKSAASRSNSAELPKLLRRMTL